MMMLHGTETPPAPTSPAPEPTFFNKYFMLFVIGGILLVSAVGPEYLHRKYGRR